MRRFYLNAQPPSQNRSMQKMVQLKNVANMLSWLYLKQIFTTLSAELVMLLSKQMLQIRTKMKICVQGSFALIFYGQQIANITVFECIHSLNLKFIIFLYFLLQLFEMNKLTLLSNGSNSRIYAYGQGEERVALKVVDTSNLKEQKHLKNQFQLLQSLHHRHVIKSLKYRQNVVFQGNKTDKQLKTITPSNILVLEHASKGSLLDYLLKEKPEISSRRLAFKSIVQGLAYLHSQGIAHRDLKLQNILVFVQDGQEIFKISDLGFATRFKSNESTIRFNDYKGTRKGYMAPQIHACLKDRSKDYDAAKTDIFALGVILFALVFDKLPFQYAVPTDSYFKKIMLKQFGTFWASHNSTLLQMEKGFRMQEMKGLFEKMVDFEPSQRPSIEQVLKFDWLLD